MAKSKIAIGSSNPNLIKDIKEHLKNLDYSVTAINKGLAEPDKLAKRSPSVLLLDIHEKNHSVLKETALKSDIPTIHLVPRSRPEVLRELNLTAPHEYVYTPVDTKDLHTTIETVLFRTSTAGKTVPQRKNKTTRKKTEPGFEDNEQALKTLLGNLPGIAYRCLNDPSWTMQFISEGCRELTGYLPSELVKNNVKAYNDIIHADDRQKVWSEIQRALKKNQKFTTSYRIITKDEQVKWVWKRGLGIRDKDGALEAIEGFITDISPIKEMEKQIKHAHLEKETILDNLLEHVLYEDKGMNILWANKSACHALGLPRGKVIGQRCHELFAKRERACPECPVSKAMETGKPHRIERKTPDGKIWYIQGTPVRDEKGKITAGIEIALDITEYKQALTALNRSEREYNELNENIQDGIVVTDKNRNIITCNSAFSIMVGYTGEELHSMNTQEITPSKWVEQEENYYKNQIFNRGFLDTYRKEYIRKDGSIIPVEVRAHLKKDENGEIIGVWAIVRDISQTVQYENELKESSNLLTATLEATADGILVVNNEGKVLHTNSHFADLWRIPNDLIASGDDNLLLDFVLDQLKEPEVFLNKVQKLYKNDLIDLDFLYFKDGRVFERYSRPLMHETKIIGRVWSFRDITEREETERKLRNNEEKLRAVVENMPIMMDALDDNGNIVAWNHECERVTGFSAKEIVGNPNAMALLYPDRKYREKMMGEWHRSDNDYRDFEWDLTCKDGTVKTVSWSSVSDQVPIPGWASWDVGLDVTESKKAYEKMEQLGLAVEQSFDGIVMVDLEQKVIYTNKTWMEMHGYTKEELVSQRIEIFYPDGKHLQTVANNLLEDKEASGWVGMTNHIRKDSTVFPSWETITVIRNSSGEPIGFVGTARDITESRKAEESLRESEEKYRLLAETASDMIVTHNMQGKITYANQAFLEFSGYSKSMLKEMKITALLQMSKTDLKLEKKGLNGTDDIQRLIYEAELVIKNRKRIPVEINSTPFLKDKIQVGRLIIARDISERKQAEKALRESEERYRRIIDNTIDLIYDITPEGTITFSSPQSKHYGIPAHEAVGKNIFEFIHPDDVEKVSNDLRRVIETGEIFPCSFRLIGADKREYHVESISKIVHDNNDHIHISGIFRDITDRKMAEDALLASEEKYRLLVENANDGIFVAQDSVIKFFNPQVSAITGFNEEELTTQPFANVIHDEDRELVMKRHQQRLQGGEVPKEYHFQIIRKDGTVRWLEVNAVMITWENRPATLNFINDITERKKAEQALIESEERFRTMSDFTYDWECWIGPDGQFVYISPSCERFTGYKAEEFIKNPNLLIDITHPDDIDKMMAHKREHIDNSKPHQLEYRIIARDGSTVWIDHICQPVYSPDGRYLGRRFSNRDVTEQQNILRALRESEEKYATIVEKANDGVILVQDEIIMFANKAMEKMLGYKVDEIVGRNYVDLTGPESRELIQQRYQLRLEGKNPPSFYEVKLTCKDDSIKECELSAEVINYQGRKATVAILRDNSERRKAEEHLRRNLAAMEAATEGIAILKDNKSFTYLNRAMARLFDYASPLEIMLLSWTDILDCEDNERLENEARTALENSGSWHSELNGIRKEGSRFPLEISLTAVEDGNIICIVRDISERKENELQGLKLHEELERARRMESLGILAGGVAHDLNNMLGPMVGYSDLILEEINPSNKPVIKMVERISKASRIAADVIQDLLTLARRGRYEMETTNLNNVIENYLDSPNYNHLIKEKPGIEVITELDRGIENILGSEPHLSKTIMNLIINAFDAMTDKGSLTISTGQVTLERLYSGYRKIKPGDFVVLKVRDTGMGIAAEDIDNIFEPYYSKKKMGTSGSGLGLAVVYGIVKDHDGYYDIFSEIGKGTEFVLYFPVSRVEKTSETIEHRDLSGSETILVVDDTVQQREIAYDLLTSLGYRVDTVANGREALEYLAQNKTDLVVLDMIMEKDLDGLDTYREIIKLHPGQKAIITSGFSVTERVDQVQKLGAGTYVKKPYTRKSLGAAVRKELEKKSGVPVTQ